MPLLAYFTVVGAVLLGLLYVAEAQLGPSPSLSVTTNFYGLPAPYKASTSTPILTARDAPATDMAPFAFAQSTATARPAAGQLSHNRSVRLPRLPRTPRRSNWARLRQSRKQRKRERSRGRLRDPIATRTA